MHPVLIDLGFLKIYSWGFMLALSVLIAIFGVGWRLEKEGMDKELSFSLIFWLILSGVIGARIGYIIVYRWSEFLADPMYLFRLTDGGLSGLMWYGGFIAASLAFLLYAKIKDLPAWKLADILSPFLILGYALVRIGCFLAGCCYGKVTTSFLGVVFPLVDEQLRYPTQLMSSGINLLFFLFLWWFYQKHSFDGQVFSITVIGYSLYRFFIEFFRASEVLYGIFSPGQVISMVLFVAGIVLYVLLAKRGRNQYQTKHISYLRKPWERE